MFSFLWDSARVNQLILFFPAHHQRHPGNLLAVQHSGIRAASPHPRPAEANRVSTFSFRLHNDLFLKLSFAVPALNRSAPLLRQQSPFQRYLHDGELGCKMPAELRRAQLNLMFLSGGSRSKGLFGLITALCSACRARVLTEAFFSPCPLPTYTLFQQHNAGYRTSVIIHFFWKIFIIIRK